MTGGGSVYGLVTFSTHDLFGLIAPAQTHLTFYYTSPAHPQATEEVLYFVLFIDPLFLLQIKWSLYTFFYKNLVYKNIKASKCPIIFAVIYKKYIKYYQVVVD